ncbi:MAG: universal stress protein [Verrucomicrobia bacterium]|nr:universal stress protein [Verrucomicrobiota bacterium]
MKVKPSAKPGCVVVEVDRQAEQLLASAGSPAPSPFRLKRILVPVDFSDCSKKALQYAVPFARQFNASLVLLNVVQVSYPAGEFGPVEPPLPDTVMEDTSRKELETLAATEIAGLAPVTTLVRVGRPADEIVLAASDVQADLLIISTHGHTGLKHVLLGSTTEHVVRRAPCPVLTVREHEHEFIAVG